MKHRWIAFVYFALVLAVVLSFDFSVDYVDGYDLIIRGMAMTALLLAFTGILSSLYIKELTKFFGRPFKKVHHLVTVTALSLMVLHPVVISIRRQDIGVFVPVTDSWIGFFRNGGRVAIYLFLVAGVTAFFATRLKKSWRYLHWLTYAGFLFAITHGMLLGANFRPGWMKIVGFVMIGIVGVVFVRKRWLRRKRQKRRNGIIDAAP